MKLQDMVTQAIVELRKAMHQMDADNKVAMARLEGKIDGLGTKTGSLKDSVESVRKKVDELVRWKTLILGGALVLGVLFSGVFDLYVKFWGRVSIAPAPVSASK